MYPIYMNLTITLFKKYKKSFILEKQYTKTRRICTIVAKENVDEKCFKEQKSTDATKRP